MHRVILNTSLVLLCVMSMWACSTAPTTEGRRQGLMSDANATLEEFRATDRGIAEHIRNAYGYAVFPTVSKGGFVVGGAYGHGIVYEEGKAVGYADITQATFGAQIGGQAYSELILFQDRHALRRMQTGEFALAAQASAVAAASGAGANADYKDGVMVFTRGEQGLMVEASVGGQKFSYQPK